jgi:hypothetical protein
MKRFITLLFFCSALAVSLRAGAALGAGETLTYRVSWGIFTGAGEIKISAEAAEPENGHPRLKVITTTATRGFARAILTFDARAESIFDVHTSRLLSTTENTKSQDRTTTQSVKFDYGKSVAIYENPSKANSPVTLPMPPGDPVDLIMSLVQTRYCDMKPGDQRDALVIFGDEFYEITLHAEKYEDVKTSLGTFHTLVLVPRMEKTPPKGMFKRGSAVKVWIAQDDRRLPVKFQVEFKFGAGVATLIHYQPPAAATVADEKKPGARSTDAKPDEIKPDETKPALKPAAPDGKNPGP